MLGRDLGHSGRKQGVEAVRYFIVIEKSRTGYSAYYPIRLAASPLTAVVQLSRRPCVRP
jgi:hypothetical protein